MADNDPILHPRGVTSMDPRGLVDRIHKKEHYKLLRTKYESFMVMDMFLFSHCKCMGAICRHGYQRSNPTLP